MSLAYPTLHRVSTYKVTSCFNVLLNRNENSPHLHPLRRISAKDVLGGSLCSLQYLHNPYAVEVVDV